MIKVVPAILAKTKQEFEEKVSKLRNLVQEVQIDICPGSYWNLNLPFDKIQAHVFTQDKIKTDKIIKHQGIVTKKNNYFLVLAVKPCEAGGEFNKKALKIIKNLRAKNPKADIAVDGGINLETGKLCAQAGANILISGTYIFDSNNIKQKINELQNCN